MKKLFLGALLLLSMSMFSQKAFIRKYTSYIITTNDVSAEAEVCDVIIVYNEDNTTNIGIYMYNTKILLYSRGEINTGSTAGGFKYQIIECINRDSGNNVGVQLFDECVRIFTNENYSDSIEYFN
jgi:hypothetical protein